MKDQVLDPGNRAALQALASLSGIVGLGALLSGVVLNRVGPQHRDAGFAAFEVFVVVAVMTSAIFTAVFSVIFLSRNEAISGDDLFQASAPLLIALVLAVILTSAGRFATLAGGLSNNFPILLATLFAAVVVGAVPAFLAPALGEIVPIVTAILLIGMFVGLVFLSLERRILNGKRRDAHQRFESLSADGYLPLECDLQVAMPCIDGEPAPFQIVCWTRKDRCYLDQTEARRLCRSVNARWVELANGNAAPPLGDITLRQCVLKTTFLPWPPKFKMITTIYRRDTTSHELHEIDVNEQGLFDVTDLGLVSELA